MRNQPLAQQLTKAQTSLSSFHLKPNWKLRMKCLEKNANFGRKCNTCISNYEFIKKIIILHIFCPRLCSGIISSPTRALVKHPLIIGCFMESSFSNVTWRQAIQSWLNLRCSYSKKINNLSLEESRKLELGFDLSGGLNLLPGWNAVATPGAGFGGRGGRVGASSQIIISRITATMFIIRLRGSDGARISRPSGVALSLFLLYQLYP